MARLLFCLGLALSPVAAVGGESFGIIWPTPNPAFAEGGPAERYVQPTVSGLVESGLFGCVRNSGTRFHEGVDLLPTARDRRGEAIDPIFAVMDGTVLYANRVAGNSSYGCYVVLEHRQVVPPVTTLYAHLSEIDGAIDVGAEVRLGQKLGIMGRSAGGYTIPRERAHLHFEIGFWISEQFQSWYDWRRFGSANHHGLLSGMNMIGFDPIDFYDQYRSGAAVGVQSYLEQLPVAYTVRVRSSVVPDFVRRYPSLFAGAMPSGGPGGWDIDFTSFGLPVRWRALAADDPGLQGKERAQVIHHNPEVAALHRCRNTLTTRRGQVVVGSHTEKMLQLLFGFR